MTLDDNPYKPPAARDTPRRSLWSVIGGTVALIATIGVMLATQIVPGFGEIAIVLFLVVLVARIVGRWMTPRGPADNR